MMALPAVNFTGSWKLDLSRSKFAGPAPKAALVTIEHQDPDLQQEMKITRADGSEEQVVFRYRTDGKPHESLLAGRKIRGVANWKGTELLIESVLEIGGKETRFRDFWSVSADGRTLSMEHHDDGLAGQISVFEKQN